MDLELIGRPLHGVLKVLQTISGDSVEGRKCLFFWATVGRKFVLHSDDIKKSQETPR